MHWDSLHLTSPTSSEYALRFLILWLTIALTPPKTRIIDKFKISINVELPDSTKSFFSFSKTWMTYVGSKMSIRPMKTILWIYDFFIKTHEKLPIVVDNGWIWSKTCFVTWFIWTFFIWKYNQMSSTICFVFSSIFIHKSSPNWYFNIANTIDFIISFQGIKWLVNVRLSCVQKL